MDGGFWFVFLSAAVLLTLSPGPDLFYILSKTVSQGRKIGIASSLGVGSGAFLHAMAAAFGISAVLTTSAFAFSIVKYAGAIYLIYLGFKSFKSAGVALGDLVLSSDRRDFWSAYRQGMMIDLLNPKVAIFFMAFLPQFVRPEKGSVIVQLVILGIIVILIGLVVEFTFVMLAGKASAFLRANNKASRWLDRALGTILIALGIRLAFAEKI